MSNFIQIFQNFSYCKILQTTFEANSMLYKEAIANLQNNPILGLIKSNLPVIFVHKIISVFFMKTSLLIENYNMA